MVGGVNSSALYFHLRDNNKPLDIVIFADTGEETRETYDAVERMNDICMKDNISFVVVKSNYGNLYDYYFKHKAIPSYRKRDCTYKFKILPIRKYLRKNYGLKEGFVMYIGLAYDELDRMKDSDVKYIVNSFPFVDDGITRQGNKDILKQYNFFAVKSGCKGCIYLNKKLWVKMIIEDPLEFNRHKLLEQNGTRYPEIK